MTPLSTYGAKPDLRLIFDAAVSGTSLTSPSGGFTADDVGKNVVVSGPTKLRTTVTAFVSATELTLAASPPSPISGGAMIGTDCSAALQAALDDTGEVLIDGRYLLTAPVSRATAGPLALCGGRIGIGTADTDIAISLSNGTARVENVVFAGVPGALADARQVLRFTGGLATVRGGGFYWLATSLSDGAVIAAVGGCDLKLERPAFYGCTSSNAIVYATAFQGFTADGAAFLDLGTLDCHETGKLVNAPAAAWVKVGDPQFSPISATAQGVVRLNDCRMDEGAVIGLLVAPTSGTRISHVSVDGHEQATYNSPTGKGICISGADFVRVARSRIGTYRLDAALHDGLFFYDCGDVEVVDVVNDPPAARITANHLGSLRIENSYGYARALTDVGALILIEHGREITPPVPNFLISDNARAVITGRVAELDSATPPPPAAWQNVAHTSGSFNGGQDFVLQVKVLTLANGIAVGLNTTPLTAGSYQSIPIGFVPSGARWNAVYGGTPHDVGPAATGDVLRIEHRAGVITWKINGVASPTTFPSPWGRSSVVFGDVDMVGTISGKVSADLFEALV